MLWVPVILFVDTNSNIYSLQLKGLLKANIEKHKEEIIRIKLNVFFANFYFYPLKDRSTSPIKENIDRKKISTQQKSKGFRLKTGLKILRSFRIKKFKIDVDTGDYIINAKMFAIAHLLNSEAGEFNINFEGRNRILLSIYNRPIYIIKAFINI